VPWTAVGQIDLPNVAGMPLAGDDSQASVGPLTPTKGDATSAQLPDGGRMIWERDSSPLRADVPRSLRFRIEDRNGNAAKDLEPYTGMAGHAAFVRSDCSVFAHNSSRRFGLNGRAATGTGDSAARPSAS
jgi:hypothetical protein